MKKSKCGLLKAICACKVLVLILIFGSLYAQNLSDKKEGLKIQFVNYVGNEILKLDSSIYKNELQQEFVVAKFKYYIWHIRLVKKDGVEYKSDRYYLINEEKLNSKTILIENIPNGEYITLHFTVGVDSIDNCSGAQSGALDPMNAMFWTWNTGYIFMKLEGTAEASTSANSIFEYHIGGFKNIDNAIRTFILPFTNSISISSNRQESVEIKTDVLEILKTPTTIDFSNLSSVTDARNASTIADNYSDMFSVLKCGNEK